MHELLAEIEGHGASLRAEGERLVCVGGKRLPAALQQEIRDRKPELLAFLSTPVAGETPTAAGLGSFLSFLLTFTQRRFYVGPLVRRLEAEGCRLFIDGEDGVHCLGEPQDARSIADLDQHAPAVEVYIRTLAERAGVDPGLSREWGYGMARFEGDFEREYFREITEPVSLEESDDVYLAASPLERRRLERIQAEAEACGLCEPTARRYAAAVVNVDLWKRHMEAA